MQSHGDATSAATAASRRTKKKSKGREVSPRFLSPASSTTSSSTDYGSHESPDSILSPIKQKPRSSTDSKKSKTVKSSGFLRGLWPSSSVPSQQKKPDTLADFIGNERREELAERKIKNKSDQNQPINLTRQRSCTEFRRLDNDRDNIYSKENCNPVMGGSMRYPGKSKFSGKSNRPSNSMESEEDVFPGRFSVDEISVRKKSLSRGLTDPDSGSELYSDGRSSLDAGKESLASYMAPTVSSRKHMYRIDVPSRFMQDLQSRSRRLSLTDQDSLDSISPRISSFKKKGDGDWASPPARSKDAFGENKAKLNSKPPTSPSNSRGKGVGNILSMGIELFKGKKSLSLSGLSSPIGPGPSENVHHLRLLHNRLTQWRYSNARAEAVDENIIKQAEVKSIHVSNALIKLRQSVLQKKLQLQKEKLEMKLDYIVHSQIKALEDWGNMERQHSSAVSSTTDYLHAAICRVPLVNGAKVELQSSASFVCHASDLATEINTMITTFQPTVEKTVGVVAELATVVIQEKQLLEECLDLFNYITALEVEERSLRSSIMQLRLLEQEQLLEIMA